MTLLEFIYELNSAISLSAIEVGRITAAIDMMIKRVEVKAQPRKLQTDWYLDEGFVVKPYIQEEPDPVAEELAAAEKLAIKFLREAAANGLITISPVVDEINLEGMALGP